MAAPWTASVKLVFRASLLVLVTGCSTVNTTKAPQPITTSAVPIAPTGLQMGYVWQANSGNLYPILGVSGAAHYALGLLPADANASTAAAISSASASWALVLRKDGMLEEWELSSSATATLASRVALDASVTFSPSGTSAALASPSTQTVVVVSGLPSKAQAASLSLPSGFAAGNLAVSDSGTVLVGLKRPGAAGVEVGVLSVTRSYSAIGNLQAWGGAGFLPGSQADSAVIADGATGQLTVIANLSGASPASSSLPNSGLLEKPAGVGVSPDGKWAYVADSGKPQILRVSLTSSASPPTTIACACTPQQVAPLTADGLFSVTANVAGQPDWILDTRTSQPRTFFVPAIASAQNQASASSSASLDRTSK